MKGPRVFTLYLPPGHKAEGDLIYLLWKYTIYVPLKPGPSTMTLEPVGRGGAQRQS